MYGRIFVFIIILMMLKLRFLCARSVNWTKIYTLMIEESKGKKDVKWKKSEKQKKERKKKESAFPKINKRRKKLRYRARTSERKFLQTLHS